MGAITRTFANNLIERAGPVRPISKPLIINGNMAVAQRGTSATGLTNGSSGFHTVDRFAYSEFGAPSSQHTMTQESLTSGNAYINGFANALKMDVTTAQSSVAAADAVSILYKIEGQDLQLFKKGTANAEKFTLAFWVKGTKTGTHVVELFDRDNNRHVAGTYSISSSDTWEHKVVNFPADTTGVFGDDNNRSLDIVFFLAAGSNFTSGDLATSWIAQDNTKRAAGQVNTLDSTSNNWHATGIQLEVGEYTSSTLPPFQHESYGENLLRCQRYFQNIADGNDKPLGMGQYWEAQEFIGHRVLSTDMRAAPTLEYVTSTNYYGVLRDGGSDQIDALTISSSPKTTSMITWYMGSSQGLASNTKNRPGFIRTQNASSKVGFTAEL